MADQFQQAEEIMKDPSFMQGLESEADIKEAFAAKGYRAEVREEAEAELNVDALDQVAGGYVKGAFGLSHGGTMVTVKIGGKVYKVWLTLL